MNGRQIHSYLDLELPAVAKLNELLARGWLVGRHSKLLRFSTN